MQAVKAIYLFGSQARREAKPISDVDICVFTEGSSAREEAEMSLSSPLIDLTLFHKLPISIQYRVFREGKMLYCADHLYLQRQQVRTIEGYLDFKPIIDRHVRNVFGGQHGEI